MFRTRTAVALAALAILPLAGCDHDRDGGPSHTEPAFQWRGTVPAGGWVRIRDLNGSVRVGQARGAETVITATRRYRGRDPQRVRFVAQPDANGVTACALWGEGGECTAERYENRRSGGSRSWFARLLALGGRRGGGVTVDYVVAVPAGVRIDARTVNGRVIVADATSEVVAHSVNGTVTVGGAGGPVRLQTVNGRVNARLDRLAAGASVELKTVNGSVSAFLPSTVDADVALATTNGRVQSDFPLASPEGGRRSLRGTLGAGGRRIALESVNGSVKLGRL
jgi:hypothetical protein